MKKFFLVSLMSVILALTVISCNSIESDARKLAKMHYELQQIGNNVGSRSNVYESKARQVLEFERKTWGKYSKNPEKRDKFQRALEAETQKLNRR